MKLTLIKINDAFLSIVLLMFFALAAYWLVIQLKPAKDWFYYSSVEPVQMVYNHYEPLSLRSTVDQKSKQLEYHWRDILYCKNAQVEDFSYYSMYESAAVISKVGPRSSIWNYNEARPKIVSICKLKSTITVFVTALRVKKTQVLESRPFRIGGL